MVPLAIKLVEALMGTVARVWTSEKDRAMRFDDDRGPQSPDYIVDSLLRRAKATVNLRAIHRAYTGSRNFQNRQFHRRCDKRSAYDSVVNRIGNLKHGKSALHCLGANFRGRRALPGERNGAPPIKGIERVCARHHLLVRSEEFHTTRRCFACGSKMQDTANLKVMHCSTCDKFVPRDRNAAGNLWLAWMCCVLTGQRPPHLVPPQGCTRFDFTAGT